MKKLALVLLTALFSIPGFSGEQTENWIQTNDGQFECTKVVVHSDYLTMTCTDGKKQNIAIKDIVSYSKNGKVFIKQSIYTKKYVKGDKKREVFMKLVTSKDGMDLLKYSSYKTGVREFVFKGKQLIQELNKTNRNEFYQFFGV